MRCFLLLCVLFFSGCGALLYQDDARSLTVLKIGVDTALESGKYQTTAQDGETSIEVGGYESKSRLELIKEIAELVR